MATDNNIKTFTAIDIEKYHKGLLSARQMHDLEKAALDDPFLADALEGYAVAGVNVAADIADLKKRLAEKTEEAKVIPLNAGRSNNFKILRAAVVVAFVAGAAFLVFQFADKKKEVTIAQNDAVTTEKIKVTDSAAPSANSTSGSDKNQTETISVPGYKKEEAAVTTNGFTKPVPTGEIKEATGGSTAMQDKTTDADVPANKPAPVINDFVKLQDEKQKTAATETNRDYRKEVARQEAKSKPGNALKKEADKKEAEAVQVGIQDDDLIRNKSIAANRKADEQANFKQSNIFRGRITDANNVGVPFANVTNQLDNVGTYTDARGYFNLTYPDSVLNVQVRSIGFEYNAVQLRNNVASTQIVLQEDHKNLSEVVVSNQKPNAAARSRESNTKIEESEPTDGWDNYDTYLANNLKEPDDFKTKKSNTASSVQVSFEVDKNGEPVNIRVEKSLCGTCDKEAIRLIKEGPKWKRAASKKGRTTVTINF